MLRQDTSTAVSFGVLNLFYLHFLFCYFFYIVVSYCGFLVLRDQSNKLGFYYLNLFCIYCRSICCILWISLWYLYKSSWNVHDGLL